MIRGCFEDFFERSEKTFVLIRVIRGQILFEHSENIFASCQPNQKS